MKPLYIIGLAIFWSVITMLGTAGLVSYENEKLIRTMQQNVATSTPVATGAAAEAARAQGASTWTQEVVAAHSTLDDCWLTIGGKIYDVTEYAPYHPGGTRSILESCGTEATEAFRTKGGDGGDHSREAYALLANYFVADLGSTIPSALPVREVAAPAPTPAAQPRTPLQTPPPTPTPAPVATPKPTPTPAPSTTLTAAVVAGHSTTNDCWIIVNGSVYNITQYIPFHPGGTNTIRPWCGKESTQAFTTRGGNGRHSQSAWSALENYRIGALNSTVSGAAAAVSPTTPPTGTPRGDDEEEYEDD